MQIKEGSAEEDITPSEIFMISHTIQKPNLAFFFCYLFQIFPTNYKNMLTLMMIHAKFSSSFHLLVAWQFLSEKQCYH